MRALLALLVALSATALATTAVAQTRPPGGGQGGQGGGPTQSRPTRSKPVGPQRGPGDDEDQQGPSPSARPGGEPTVQTPQDPLAIPDRVKETIGSDFDGAPTPPEGRSHRSFFPYYEERKGDYRFRLIPAPLSRADTWA